VVSGRVAAALRRVPLWRYAAAIGIVLISALSVEILYVLLNTTRLSMVLLAGVLVAAVTLGARPAYLAAGLAFLIYDFYLSAPRFELTIGSAEDVIVMITFLFVAVLTGGLAGRARDEGRKAKDREASARTLYEASRELSAIGDEDAIRDRLAARIVAIAQSSFCFWTEDLKILKAIGQSPPVELEVQAFWLLDSGTPSISHVVWRDAWRIRRLRHDAPDLGLVAWRVEGTREEVGAIDTIVNILVDLGAAAIIRARLSARQAQMEALAKTEQLRNALLSRRFPMTSAPPWRPSWRLPAHCENCSTISIAPGGKTCWPPSRRKPSGSIASSPTCCRSRSWKLEWSRWAPPRSTSRRSSTRSSGVAREGGTRDVCAPRFAVRTFSCAATLFFWNMRSAMWSRTRYVSVRPISG
jgi:hypothetical protein